MTGGSAPSAARRVRIVGTGRAGGSFARVLADLGWQVLSSVARGAALGRVARQVDLVVIATPDRSVAEVAAAIDPDPGALVVHVAGSLGLDVLAGHPRRGALHPLVSLPDATTGAERLQDGAWFAVAADSPEDEAMLASIVEALGGRGVAVSDDARAAYHAAATVASNHLVALLGQVDRIASSTGVPLEAFLDLARGSLEGVAVMGPARALTGPVSRGDWHTVERHLGALAEVERPGYAAVAELAARLAPGIGDPPPWLVAARQAAVTDRSNERG